MSVTENIIRIRNVTKVFQMGVGPFMRWIMYLQISIRRESLLSVQEIRFGQINTAELDCRSWKSRQKEGFCFTISTSNG